MRAAKIVYTCSNCGHEAEGKGECIRHLPKQRTAKSTPRIKITPEDQAFSVLIRERAGGLCERCGKKPEKSGLHAAHIFSRRHKATRHDSDNALALCMGCHFWGHRNPTEFLLWVQDRMGAEAFEALRQRAQATSKRVQRRAS